MNHYGIMSTTKKKNKEPKCMSSMLSFVKEVGREQRVDLFMKDQLEKHT